MNRTARRGEETAEFIDGPINENLVIKGNNIKLNRPGTYKISYDCTDSAGNSANTSRLYTTFL